VFSMLARPSSSRRLSSFSRSNSSICLLSSSRSRISSGFTEASRPLIRPRARSMRESICSRRRFRRSSIRSKGSASFHSDSSISPSRPPDSRNEAGSVPSGRSALEGGSAFRTFYEDRGIPDGSLVRVVREDLREMFPARRGLVRLRDAQGRQPYDPDILRDFQEGFHLLLVEGEDPGGPQPLTRCRDGDV